MQSEQGLVFGYELCAKRGLTQLARNEIDSHQPDGEKYTWLDFNYDAAETEEWLRQQDDIPDIVRKSVLLKESRPRCMQYANGVLICLRGINFNQKQQMHDMVSLRVWVEANRVITFHNRRVHCLDKVVEELDSGHVPISSSDLLIVIIDKLSSRLSKTIGKLHSKIDEIEDRILAHANINLRPEVAKMRRQTIAIRRYVSPQRDALSTLQILKINWLDEDDRLHLRELSDRTLRLIEELDSAREQAAVCQEELTNFEMEQTNRRMYILALLSAIFLPLGFIAGLLGINVAGIPAATDPDAFWTVCLIMVGIAIGLYVAFKKLRWL